MPDRQVDLFLDTLVNAPIKDDRALMEFPFFSLQKQPRMEPLVYDDGRVQVRISPGERGLATIWDKDILIYIASVLNDRIERGAPVSRTVAFPAYDFLRLTGRGTSATVYEQLKDALFRLRSTTITTSIKAAGSNIPSFYRIARTAADTLFCWIISAKRWMSGRRRVSGMLGMSS